MFRVFGVNGVEEMEGLGFEGLGFVRLRWFFVFRVF